MRPPQPLLSLTVAGLTMAVQNGVVMAFSVFYLPLVEEFGEGRAAVAVVQSLVVLLGGVGAPLAGAALDRWGPRRLFQSGALVAALGLLLASRTHDLRLLLAAYGLLGGAGLAVLGSLPNMVVVAQWFPGRRGQAIALADLGTGLGAALAIPLAQLLVVRTGWRGALLAFAGLLTLLIPANALQRLPSETARSGAALVMPNTSTLRVAAATAAFWWLALLRFFAGIAFQLVNVHAVAFAVGAGVHPLRAASALGGVSLVSLVGRTTIGWLADRLGREAALTIGFGSALVGLGGLGLLGVTGWPGWLVGFVLFYGLAQGSGGIVSTAKATDLFAGPSVGMIAGWIAVASGPGEAFGAWGGGLVYDLTGSYLGALAVSALALLAGIWAIWRLPAEPGPAPARPLGGGRV